MSDYNENMTNENEPQIDTDNQINDRAEEKFGEIDSDIDIADAGETEYEYEYEEELTGNAASEENVPDKAEHADPALDLDEDTCEDADVRMINENAEDDTIDEDTEDQTEESEDDIDEEPKKKRTGWTWVTTLIVVVSAVLVLGMLGFLGVREGWFDGILPKAKSSCTIGDYSRIEVLDSEVEVTDEMIDNYIDSLLADYPDQEFDDAWVQTYSGEILNQDMADTDEFRNYVHDYIYNYYLHSAMMDYLRSITTVKSYDEEKLEELMEYSGQGLSYYASMYGVDADAFAKYQGYESAEDFERHEAENYLTSIMMLDKLMKEKKLSYTPEEVDEDMQVYMNINGLTMYSLDEFKELSGETWCYLYEYIQFRSDLVMDALEDNVVFLEDTPE